MVTTIKITCDGVFIQTNSNLNQTTNEQIVTDSSINIINLTNRRHYRPSNGHSIHLPNKLSSNGIVKRCISVHNIGTAPQSLPNLQICNDQPALISPRLVKALSCVERNRTHSSNEINSISSSPSLSMSSSVPAAKSIHKVIRNDKFSECTTQSISPGACEWDFRCDTNKENSTVHNGAGVRRRNTFKSYLIECKENIVRRLSTPTPLIG